MLYSIQIWQYGNIIPKGTKILEGTVAPNFGQPGGGYQFYIPDPSVVIKKRVGSVHMKAFREKVLQAIRICNEELENRKRGVSGESTEEELNNVILPELNRLLVMIDNKQFPPKEERYLNSFAHAFTVWGWNMQKPTKLFVLLTELNNEFKKI